MFLLSHKIHVWHIYLYVVDLHDKLVGQFTNPMDPSWVWYLFQMLLDLGCSLPGEGTPLDRLLVCPQRSGGLSPEVWWFVPRGLVVQFCRYFTLKHSHRDYMLQEFLGFSCFFFSERALQGGPLVSYKWDYNPYYPFIRPFIGVLTSFITGRGPPCSFLKKTWGS